MAFKPNYNQQRRDRDRAKAQKKQEKLQRKQEVVDKRKAERGDDARVDARQSSEDGDRSTPGAGPAKDGAVSE